MDSFSAAGFSEHWQHSPHPHGPITQTQDYNAHDDEPTMKAVILSLNICGQHSFLLFFVSSYA
jgi:hypothetical protein